MTLDGVVDHMEEWHFQYFDEAAGEFARNQLFGSDALLMGRRTYEGFAESWPTMEEQTGDFGVRMNSLPHYVVSSTLEKADWGDTTIISGDVLAAVAELKERPGQDILMYGYDPLAHELLRNGLLDEIRVWLHPIMAGHAGAESLLFRDGNKVPLELADTHRFDSGVIIPCYHPAAQQD